MEERERERERERENREERGGERERERERGERREERGEKRERREEEVGGPRWSQEEAREGYLRLCPEKRLGCSVPLVAAPGETKKRTGSP